MDEQTPAPSAKRMAGVVGAAALAGLAGCNAMRDGARQVAGAVRPEYAPLPDAPSAREARRVLNRVAFGAKPGETARVAQTGAKNWLEEQLADNLAEDPIVEWRVGAIDLQERVRSAPDTANDVDNDQLMTETAQAAILRAVYSRHQLRETLADFWTNHFNIYALKSNERELVAIDAETVIRPRIFGKFRDLLLASAHSAAMLSYLDNQQNKKGVANENYARELLELHTLGVNSGYTQQDVRETARCFTGWGVQTPSVRLRANGVFANFDNPYPGFRYAASLHDEGAKHIPFLNLRIAPNGGEKDADSVLERLATHEATARFLARKLCRRYLGSVPPEIADRAAKAYLKSDTDIRALLRPILLDGVFDPACNRPVLKRPLDFAASALRAMGADTDGGANLQKRLSGMGQPLYQWPMPDGFPEKAAAWTGSLLGRWNFAFDLAANRIEGTQVDLEAGFKALGAQSDESKIAAAVEILLNLPAKSSEALPVVATLRDHLAKARRANLSEGAIMAEVFALTLASPAFQWR